MMIKKKKVTSAKKESESCFGRMSRSDRKKSRGDEDDKDDTVNGNIISRSDGFTRIKMSIYQGRCERGHIKIKIKIKNTSNRPVLLFIFIGALVFFLPVVIATATENVQE